MVNGPSRLPAYDLDSFLLGLKTFFRSNSCCSSSLHKKRYSLIWESISFWELINIPFSTFTFLIVLSTYLAFSRLQKNLDGFSFSWIFCTLDRIMKPRFLSVNISLFCSFSSPSISSISVINWFSWCLFAFYLPGYLGIYYLL